MQMKLIKNLKSNQNNKSKGWKKVTGKSSASSSRYENDNKNSENFATYFYVYSFEYKQK